MDIDVDPSLCRLAPRGFARISDDTQSHRLATYGPQQASQVLSTIRAYLQDGGTVAPESPLGRLKSRAVGEMNNGTFRRRNTILAYDLGAGEARGAHDMSGMPEGKM
jgi:hypothetical protein